MEVSNSDKNNNPTIISVLGPLSSQVMSGQKMSHKTWRGVLKKLKRKLKRRKAAEQEEQENPSCNGDASEDDAVKQHIQDKEMQLQLVEHARWLQREKKAHEDWLKKKWLEEQEKKRQEEQDRRIKEEWEESQRKEKEEKEKLEAEEQKKKEEQEALLSEATANEKATNGPPQPWHNPLAPPGYGKEAEVCSFFMKTGACRFGERCSRSHPEPETCHTLMFPGMYTHMILDKSQDDYDTDLTLEFEEGEIYDDFKQFYEDVLPEFKSVGQVIQFKVSCNFEPHLRGNVYVQYKTEDEAMKAYTKFNGRWYGGKQLSCQVVEIKRWVAAICGLYNENRCHKGKACNFLHVFHNPTREFNRADRDFDSQNYRHPSKRHRREHSVTSHHSSSSSSNNQKHRSYQKNHSRYSPSRSRSTSSQSLSRKKKRRDSSLSPNYSPQGKSSKKSKSRSRSRRRFRSRSRHGTRSRSNTRSRSRSRTRSRSKSPQSSKLSSHKSEKFSHRYQSSKGLKRSKPKFKGRSRISKSHSKSQSSKSPTKSRGRSSSSSSSSSSSLSSSPSSST